MSKPQESKESITLTEFLELPANSNNRGIRDFLQSGSSVVSVSEPINIEPKWNGTVRTTYFRSESELPKDSLNDRKQESTLEFSVGRILGNKYLLTGKDWKQDESPIYMQSLPSREQIIACKTDRELYDYLGRRPWILRGYEFTKDENKEFYSRRAKDAKHLNGKIDIPLGIYSSNQWVCFSKIKENKIRYLLVAATFYDLGGVNQTIAKLEIREGIFRAEHGDEAN